MEHRHLYVKQHLWLLGQMWFLHAAVVILLSMLAVLFISNGHILSGILIPLSLLTAYVGLVTWELLQLFIR